MPSSYRFVLKDSHPAILAAAKEGEEVVVVGETVQYERSATPVTETKSTRTKLKKFKKPPHSPSSLTPQRVNPVGALFGRTRSKQQESALAPSTSSGTRSACNFNSTTDSTNSVHSASPSTKIVLNDRLQGRSYTSECAMRDGLRLEDMRAGMKYAAMSITDDKPGTLASIGKTNPWQIQAMKLMLQDEVIASKIPSLGSPRWMMNAAAEAVAEEQIKARGETRDGDNSGSTKEFWKNEVHSPLSVLLSKYYNLELDCHLDYGHCGMNEGGHVIDTQGYIAHNDTTIVLAYRCTTSVKDWLSNLATTTSAWQTEDVERGHSGRFSGLSEIVGFNRSDDDKHRVHTGFYNNFLCTVQDIHKYIDPLLLDKSKPRTLYVVGHSLGGGIAHCALCYFLFEYQCHEKQEGQPQLYDWKNGPHRLVLVTAGSPRVYTTNVQCRIDNMLNPSHETYQKNVTVIRLVRDKDIVASVPPKAFGFKHLVTSKFVYIAKDDAVLINPNLKNVIPKNEFRTLLQRHPSIVHNKGKKPSDMDDVGGDESSSDGEEDRDDDFEGDEDEDDGEGAIARLKERAVTWWYGDEKVGTHEDNDDGENEKEEECETNVFDDAEDRAYQKQLRMIPRSLRDHMPEFYLQPLMSLFVQERTTGPIVPATKLDRSRDSIDGAYVEKDEFQIHPKDKIIIRATSMSNNEGRYGDSDEEGKGDYDEEEAIDVVWYGSNGLPDSRDDVDVTIGSTSSTAESPLAAKAFNGTRSRSVSCSPRGSSATPWRRMFSNTSGSISPSASGTTTVPTGPRKGLAIGMVRSSTAPAASESSTVTNSTIGMMKHNFDSHPQPRSMIRSSSNRKQEI